MKNFILALLNNEFVQRLISENPAFFKKVQIGAVLVALISGALIYAADMFHIPANIVSLCWNLIMICGTIVPVAQLPKKDPNDIKK